MNSTRIDSLLRDLDHADPADAADLAEALAQALAGGLDAEAPR
jgi:hypothetical protein